MTRNSTAVTGRAPSGVGRAYDEMTASFERFCLAAGLDALGAMMEADAVSLCGARHGRDAERRAHRWGRTAGPIGFHGGEGRCCPSARARTRRPGSVAAELGSG